MNQAMADSETAERILVVDDKMHNLKLLQSMLGPHGYEIITASNGIEALARAAEMLPDLILLDVLMPGMDGFEVARTLRAREESRGIPILMLTALNELQDKVRDLEAGADDFLCKPFHGVELLARVRSLLRIKKLHDELQTKNALLERILMRYISEDIARQILSNPTQNLKLGGQSCQVSVLFADIRGFSHFSEQHEAMLVTEVLNKIFNDLAPTIFHYHGTLDKYLGDAIMAFYGAPVPLPNNTAQAVYTACSMRERFEVLQRETVLIGQLGMGFGISTGEAVVGNIGSERMMDFTVIGNTPNIAKRLQESAGPGQILIDLSSYQAIQEIVEVNEIESLMLKGYREPIRAFEVLRVLEPSGGVAPLA